jgi:hypothetical protein
MGGMDEEELLGVWYPYEGGSTLGAVGPEGGTLLADEEFGVPDEEEEAHARLTLERSPDAAGFTVTATLYGWMYLIRRVPEESTARSDYETLRAELERLSELFPYEEDGPALAEKKAQELVAAIEEVEARFAG